MRQNFVIGNIKSPHLFFNVPVICDLQHISINHTSLHTSHSRGLVQQIKYKILKFLTQKVQKVQNEIYRDEKAIHTLSVP